LDEKTSKDRKAGEDSKQQRVGTEKGTHGRIVPIISSTGGKTSGSGNVIEMGMEIDQL